MSSPLIVLALSVERDRNRRWEGGLTKWVVQYIVFPLIVSEHRFRRPKSRVDLGCLSRSNSRPVGTEVRGHETTGDDQTFEATTLNHTRTPVLPLTWSQVDEKRYFDGIWIQVGSEQKNETYISLSLPSQRLWFVLFWKFPSYTFQFFLNTNDRRTIFVP